MTTATTVRSVADALEDVARWRAEEEARQKSELVEVDDQLSTMKRNIEQLQQQLVALEAFREELAAKGESISDAETARLYQAIFEAMGEQQIAVEERGAVLVQGEAERLSALEKVLAESDLGDKLQEYRQFKETVEPALAAMPESYRAAIEQVHHGVAEALRVRIAELLAEPLPFDEGSLHVEIVFGVDAPEGPPELLIAVTPVHESVHGEWAERTEDLQTYIALRTVQGLLAGCKAAGLPNAQVAAGGHLGLLALEADLEGGSENIASSIETELMSALSNAPELQAANLTFSVRQVEVDHLLPPEDDDAE